MGGAPIDLLYRLTQRDQAYPHWGPAQGRIVHAGVGPNLATTEAEFDAVHLAPVGTILFLTAVLVIGRPLGGATVRQVTVEIIHRTTGVIATELAFRSNVAPVAGQEMAPETPVDYALDTQRYWLRGSSLGVGVQVSLDLSWTGYVVPRGEIGFT